MQKDPEHMKKYCSASCYAPAPITQTEDELIAQTTQFGVQQEAAGDSKEQTMEVILQSIDYMKKLNAGTARLTKCVNKHEFCSFWATDGTTMHGICNRQLSSTNVVAVQSFHLTNFFLSHLYVPY